MDEKGRHTDAWYRANLGKRIQKLRTERDLSLRGLAQISRVDLKYLWRVESGDANASVNVLVKISNALDVELSELFLSN